MSMRCVAGTYKPQYYRIGECIAATTVLRTQVHVCREKASIADQRSRVVSVVNYNSIYTIHVVTCRNKLFELIVPERAKLNSDN